MKKGYISDLILYWVANGPVIQVLQKAKENQKAHKENNEVYCFREDIKYHLS